MLLGSGIPNNAYHHTTKLQSCYLAFAAGLCMPALMKNKKPNGHREQAYVNTTCQYLSAAAHLKCWNHDCVKRCKKMVWKPHRSSTGCVCISHCYSIYQQKKRYSKNLDEMAQLEMECSFLGATTRLTYTQSMCNQWESNQCGFESSYIYYDGLNMPSCCYAFPKRKPAHTIIFQEQRCQFANTVKMEKDR